MGSKERVVRDVNAAEAIKVSNRFGGLEGEEEKEKASEETVRDGDNKENENSMNLNLEDSSRRFGSEVTFGAKGVSGNQTLNKTGYRDKKMGNARGPNPKARNVGPARGRVFGPIRGETELSMSGKRLRVEKETVGRPGGAFTGIEKDTGHGEKQSGLQIQPASMANLSLEISVSQMEKGEEPLEEVEA